MIKAYWFEVCPRCHGQGRLVIRKKIAGNNLFFCCDECEAAWDREQDIGDKQKIFLGFDVRSVFADLQDIKSYGWERYMVNEYFE